MKEIWKDIKNYVGLYQISNFGNVKRIKFINGTTSFEKHKLLKPTSNGKNNYLKVNLCKNNKRKSYFVHRLVAEAFIKNTYNKPNINHKDFDTKNNNVNNLEWCTQKENINYSRKLNRYKKHFKDQDVIQDYLKNISVKNIKQKYNICERTLYNVLIRNNIKRKRYKGVK